MNRIVKCWWRNKCLPLIQRKDKLKKQSFFFFVPLSNKTLVVIQLGLLNKQGVTRYDRNDTECCIKPVEQNSDELYSLCVVGDKKIIKLGGMV